MRDEILDTTELAAELAAELYLLKPGLILEKCGSAVETAENGLQMIELYSKKRGFLLRGGVIDSERGARIFLDEYRAGKFGRITLEPVDFVYRQPEEESEGQDRA